MAKFIIVTINRAKEVVRSSEADTFKKALDAVSEKKFAAEQANWKTFVNGTYMFPDNITRTNVRLRGNFVTSFSMINGKKSEGGDYFFTYIKKAA